MNKQEYNMNNVDIQQQQTKDLEIIDTCISSIEQKVYHSKQVSKKTRKEESKTTTHVTLTCYQPVMSQCDDSPLCTADNSTINLNKLKSGDIKWVAISRDLLYLIPMGSKVKITDEENGKCYGIYTVKDKMNSRWNHRMDILIHPDSKERIHSKNVKVELIS